MSAWSEAFSEVKAAVEPDADPQLSFGDGETPDSDAELDAAILKSARGVPWEASLVVTYGQTVFPSVRNGHRYRVTTSGTMAATEPSWPTSNYASVSSGTAVLEEEGMDFESVYDTRAAIKACWLKKAAKSSEYLRTSDSDESGIHQRCIEMANRYQSVGIA